MDRDGQVTVQQDEALGSHHSLDGDSGSSSMCVIPKPIFIISDCTGESAVRTVRAALQQFELCFGRVGAPATLLVFRFVEDEEKAGQIIETAASEDALVVYTLVHPGALKAVQTACKLLKVRSVDLWGNLLDGLEAHLDATRSGMPGLTDPADKARRPVLPPDYFAMIEAVEYTRKMDDGANPKEWRSADLLILGVSRCGKTPLSIFLGQRGYKVANLPLVPGLPLPKELYEMDQTRIVGLTIDPAVLLSIRRNRVGMMGVRELGVPIDYAEIQSINAELTWARSLYAANPEWPVLDVTLRGVEETAARILKILNDKRGDASPQWVEELYGKMARRAAPPPTPLSPAITRLNPAAEQMYIGGEQYLVEGLY